MDTLITKLDETVDSLSLMQQELEDIQEKLNNLAKFDITYDCIKYIREDIEKQLRSYRMELNNTRDIIRKYREECSHVYPDGKSALEYEVSDSHHDWYVCNIYGKTIKD